MSNFPFGTHPGPTDPRSKFPALTGLDKSNYAWRILSEGNPSAPSVSLPTFIAEMKDIPQLMKNWYEMFIRGRTLFRAFNRELLQGRKSLIASRALLSIPEILASGHLTWRWAIAPFIRDVNKLCNFVELVQKRADMINKLASGHVIRTRVALAKNYLTTVLTGQTLHSEGIVIKGKRITDFFERVWGTVSYRLPGGKLFPSIGADQVNLARRLVLGLTTHEALATAWELMPWSWFVDWFLSIGTVINATNNTLGLVHNDCCLMRHSYSDCYIVIDPATSETWAVPNRTYHETYDRKERFVVAPVLPFAPTYLPVLTGKALSILGSLVVLQQKPGHFLGPVLVRVHKLPKLRR